MAPTPASSRTAFMPSANAIWTLGRHTVSFGGNYATPSSTPSTSAPAPAPSPTDDLQRFCPGLTSRPAVHATGFYVSSFLQGDASRYYRANQLGTYVQDKFQITPTPRLTAGLRYDWDGGLTEKYGRIFNFDPSYLQLRRRRPTPSPTPASSSPATTSNGTPGVSATTLTGRQWGIAPRVGVAWQPEIFHNKVVVRAGTGMYYDRGELFSYFSPGYAIGTVTGGPFGVNQQLPFVNASDLPDVNHLPYYQRLHRLPAAAFCDRNGNLANPYGTAPTPSPPNPKVLRP